MSHAPGARRPWARLLWMALAVHLVGVACDASHKEWPSALESGAASGQALRVPAQVLVPTEVGTDGRAAGLLRGTGGVGADGTAHYTLPLWVPPGRAGVQPQLALAYSSAGVNGPLGKGFSLSGASSISRCARTLAQDGSAEPVAFTSEDAFCLDGQRLVAVRGTYGAPGTEYRTERDSFSKVVSLGGDARGPAGFRVYLKNGRILTYGIHNGSTLTGYRVRSRSHGPQQVYLESERHSSRLAWKLSQEEDRSGNLLTFHYTVTQHPQSGGDEQTLERIDYTASAGGAPATRSIAFVHEARPDVRTLYVSGFKLRASRRLKAVLMYAPSPWRRELVREYRLAYTQDTLTGESLLSRVEECDGAGVCLSPLSFDWTAGDAGYEHLDTGLTEITHKGLSRGDSPHWRLQPADVDGDGRDDLLYRMAVLPTTPGRLVWQVRHASDGYASRQTLWELPVACGRPGLSEYERWLDLDADGRTDGALQVRDCAAPYGTGAHSRGYLSTGRGLSAQPPQSLTPFWFADLEGDGLPEWLEARGPLGTTHLFHLPNGPEGWGALQPLEATPSNERLHATVRLEGTAKTSLLVSELRRSPASGLFEPVGTRYLALTKRAGGVERRETTLVRRDVRRWQYFFADVNGDGLEDALSSQESGGDIAIQLNTGDGFAPAVVQDLAPEDEVGRWRGDNGVRVLDANGDGRQDVLLMDDGGGRRSQLVLLESHGEGFTPRRLPIAVGRKLAAGYVLSQTLDVNGDGLVDVAQVEGDTLHLYVRKGKPSGLLGAVVDGFGAVEEFGYKPLTDGAVYTPGTGCAWPQQCVRKGTWVVATPGTRTGW